MRSKLENLEQARRKFSSSEKMSRKSLDFSSASGRTSSESNKKVWKLDRSQWINNKSSWTDSYEQRYGQIHMDKREVQFELSKVIWPWNIGFRIVFLQHPANDGRRGLHGLATSGDLQPRLEEESGRGVLGDKRSEGRDPGSMPI